MVSNRPFFIAITSILAVASPALSQAIVEERADLPEATDAKVLQQFCFDCHGPETQEANLRFDHFDSDGNRNDLGPTFQKMLGVVSDNEMPPQDAPQPSAEQRAALAGWIKAQLDRLEKESRGRARWSRNRRLTVQEYEYTMQALFGVDAEFKDMLPADPISADGYRNATERLGLSSLQIEAYLDSARRAVDRYIRFGELSAEPLRYVIELEDLYYSTAKRYLSRERAPQPVADEEFETRRAAPRNAPRYVDPLGPTPPGAFSEDEKFRAAIPKLHQQYVAIPERLAVGELIVRVRAAGTRDRQGRFPRLRAEAGITLGDGCSIDKRSLGEVDVTASLDEPETYQFRMRLEDIPSKGPLRQEDVFDRLSVFDMDQIFLSNVSTDEQAIFGLGRGAYASPKEGSAAIASSLERMAKQGVNLLHLDRIAIEMLPGVGNSNASYRWTLPSNDQWGDRTQQRDRVTRFLRDFMTTAYRRPVTEQELQSKLKLFREFRSQQYTVEESIRETLAAVLISPSFLFLESSPSRLTASTPKPNLSSYQKAARLSYLLWLSPPDAELMTHAIDGSIHDPDVIRRESKRLLDDPRSRRFLESFCRQWLRLDKHDHINVDRDVYPNFDNDLASLTLRETVEFFIDVVRNDRSALDLIDSDHAMLNDRLARLYGISDVDSGDLRPVRLPPDSVRGGLLTQASLLTIHSDGVDSHPVRRGVWILDRLLNRPPPPPPKQVPEIDDSDPDLRGLTLKERIERHREPSACNDCHRRIDPWGIALENFDAIGQWRSEVTSRGDQPPQTRPVDSSSTLPDGVTIDGVIGLKQHLLEHCREDFADAVVHHLLTYALGRPPLYAEREQVDQIRQKFANSDYRIQDLILAVTTSELFLPRTTADETMGEP